jgi:adhesin/invasin
MTSRLRPLPARALPLAAVCVAAALAVSACDKAPLVAPSGTAITLLAGTNVLPVNGEVDITAVLIEGGLSDAGSGAGATTTTTAGAGTPVHNGTVVTFTTTLGRLEPTESTTASGRATTKLIADGRSGVATITAFSGAATQTLDVKIGAAGAAHISVTANPQTLPGTGGSSTIVARVEDVEGNGLPGVPVSFSTTKGTLSATSALTGDQGTASTTLSTTADATVTATTGGASAATTGTVDVTLKPRTTVSIAAPASATVGVPASFTITPGTGAIITNVTVDFGDGTSTDLGAITAATTVAHPFRQRGVLNVTATATDSEGGTGVASTQVAVAPLAVTVSFSPSSPQRAQVVAFTATPTSGALVDRYEWDFGDGDTSVATSNQVTHSFASAGGYVVSVRAVPFGGGEATTQLVTVNVTN